MAKRGPHEDSASAFLIIFSTRKAQQPSANPTETFHLPIITPQIIKNNLTTFDTRLKFDFRSRIS